MLSIGDVAREAGVTPRIVRYYEQHGLVSSERSSGGQRRYTDAAIERVHFIHRLIRAGLTTAVIRDLLPCVNTRVATPETLRQLAAHRDYIADRAAELNRMHTELDDLIASAKSTLAGEERPSRSC